MIIRLIFILYFFTFSLHLESKHLPVSLNCYIHVPFLNLLLIKGEDCCPLKSVGGTLYKFVDHVSEEERKRLQCSNTCAYEHAEKDSDAKYCFKPGKLESSCEEVFSTTTVTTPNPEPEVTGKVLLVLEPAPQKHP